MNVQRNTFAVQQRSSGAMTLFVAAILLPLIFLFFIVTIDIEKYLRDTARAQTTLDEAAAYAFRVLPDVERAKSAAKLYLQVNAPHIADATRIEATANGIRLTAETVSKLSFASFFAALGGGQDASLLGMPLHAHVDVRGPPLDAFIAMEVSASLAPELAHGDLWGERGDWPAATLFAGETPQIAVRNAEGRNFPGELVTQQCFNPLFSSLKMVTIQLYRTIASASKNVVGAGFFPGGIGGVEIAQQTAPPSVFETPAVNWVPSAADPFSVRNEHCLSASAFESATPSYWLPQFDPLSPRALDARQPIATAAVIPGAWVYDPRYAAITLPEVVWSQAVRPPSWVVNSDEVVDVVVRTVASQPLRRSRGALAVRAVRVGVIIAADMPRRGAARFPEPVVIDALQRKAAELSAVLQDPDAPWLRVRVYYLMLMNRPGTSFATTQDEVAALSDFFATLSTEQLSFKVIAAPNAELLQAKGVEAIMAEQRIPIVAR